MERESIPHCIEALRRALGLTQERLAHVLGVTFSTVSRWENGHVKPSRLAWTQLRGLALHHGLDPDVLGWPDVSPKHTDRQPPDVPGTPPFDAEEPARPPRF
jgi:putative transcriptional regulator